MQNEIPCRDNNYCLHTNTKIYEVLTEGDIYFLNAHVYSGVEYKIVTQTHKVYYYCFYDCPGNWALLNDVPIPEQLHIDLYTFIQNHQDQIKDISEEK
jgi:hypothetical protein